MPTTETKHASLVAPLMALRASPQEEHLRKASANSPSPEGQTSSPAPSLFSLRPDMQLVEAPDTEEGKGANVSRSLTKLADFYNLSTRANDQNAIAENAFARSAHVTNQSAFAIYRTALALGISPPELNSFCDLKFQDETSPMKKWLVARKGNFGQPNEPRVDITWKSMIRLIHKPDCISTAQIKAGLPFAMPQRVAVDLPPAYYNTVIAITRTINKYPELLDINYIHPTLANYYLAGQLPYN